MTFINVTTDVIHNDNAGEVLGADDVIFVDTGVKVEGLGAGPAQYDGIVAAQTSGDGIAANIQGSVVGTQDGLSVVSVGNNTITVTASGSITSVAGSFGWGVSIAAAGGNNIVNDGLIAGPTGGIVIGGSGQNTIMNSGTVTSSEGPAVKVSGIDNSITNTGLVNAGGATFAAIEIDSTNTANNVVTNSGQVAGAIGIQMDGENGSDDYINNSGTIQGTAQGILEGGGGGGSLAVSNSGTIMGASGINFVGLALDTLTNTGTIEGFNITAVREDGAGPLSLHNEGKIGGRAIGILNDGTSTSAISNAANAGISSQNTAINLYNGQDSVTNHGSISGAAGALIIGAMAMEGGSTIVNSGNISATQGIAIQIAGSLNTIDNSGTIDGLTTGLLLKPGAGSSGGNGIANSGTIAGNVAIEIDGASGGLDTLHNTGTISGNLTSGAMGVLDAGGSSLTLVNDSKISGFDAIRFGSHAGAMDTLNNSGSIVGINTAIVETGGGALHVINSGHIVGDVYMGAGGSSYIGAQGTLDGSVFGGSGSDTIKGGADGEALNGGAGNDLIKGGAGDDTITGGAGADKLVGGGGNDTFVYTGFADSHGPSSHDTIVGFDALSDTFDFEVAVSGVDKAITSGTLDKAAFNTDMQAILTSTALHAHHAVLFTPNAGDLAGHTFLIVDDNGVAGYQSTADYVIELSQGVHLANLSTTNFI